MLSPLIWTLLGIFNVPGGKAVLSRLIPLVVVYCLVRFKGQWRLNLARPEFKRFAVISGLLLLFLTIQHLMRGESFSFTRTLLAVLLYLLVVPWQQFTLSTLTRLCALSGMVVGAGAVYEVMLRGISRAGTLAANPIPYATFAAIILLACLCALLSSSTVSSRDRALYFLGATGAIIAVILSGTRGIWLGVLVALVITAIISMSRWKTRAAIFTMIGVIVLAGASTYTLDDRVYNRYKQTLAELRQITADNLNTSIGIRLQLWERGLDYVGQAPLLGIGSQHYPDLIEEDVVEGDITARAAPLADVHFHNQYIDTLVRTGLAGLLLLLAWTALPATQLFTKHGTLARNISTSTLSLILVAGLTDVPFHHTHLVYVYSLLLGILLLIPSPKAVS
ncbi:O-antigen ligase family protein [Zobellella sp. An-6]|uniref:O-antigen ligase family protein n=1 Tax=Zobellella sp. An-6 TaxID=3400218 RepID=UPI004042641E